MAGLVSLIVLTSLMRSILKSYLVMNTIWWGLRLKRFDSTKNVFMVDVDGMKEVEDVATVWDVADGKGWEEPKRVLLPTEHKQGWMAGLWARGSRGCDIKNRQSFGFDRVAVETNQNKCQARKLKLNSCVEQNLHIRRQTQQLHDSF